MVLTFRFVDVTGSPKVSRSVLAYDTEDDVMETSSPSWSSEFMVIDG
jgi:hypothetical protein